MHPIYSKKIAILGSKDEIPPSRKQVQLQSKIRLGVSQFLKDKLVALPSLPTEQELVKLQNDYRQEIQRQVELERQTLLSQQQLETNGSSSSSSGVGTNKSRSKSSSPRRTPSRTGSLVTFTIGASTVDSLNSQSTAGGDSESVSLDSGWGVEQRKALPAEAISAGNLEAAHPMLLQINIIRNYIKQAREAHKYDEVNMLEENLKELEIEYILQQDKGPKCATSAAANANSNGDDGKLCDTNDTNLENASSTSSCRRPSPVSASIDV